MQSYAIYVWQRLKVVQAKKMVNALGGRIKKFLGADLIKKMTFWPKMFVFCQNLS